MIDHLFVYGTLQPGESRWQFLEPFVHGVGFADSVPGRLFDTGLGYPAAAMSQAVDAVEPSSAVIKGHTFELVAESLEVALRTLDDVEGSVRGLYRRVEVVTTRGTRAWAYEYGADPADDLELRPLAGGDWLRR